MKKPLHVLFVVGVILLSTLVGCSDLSHASHTPVSQSYTVTGSVSLTVLSGAAPRAYVSSSARAAFPSQFDTSLIYWVTANKKETDTTVRGTVSSQEDGSLSYSVTLTSEGTWEICVYATIENDENVQSVYRGSADYSTGSGEAPSITLEPQEYSSDVTFPVSLPISLELETYTVSRIAYYIDSEDNTAEIPIAENTATLETELFPGNHRLVLYFYNENGARIFMCRENVTVFAGAVTDTWYGTSQYFTTDDDGTTRFVLTDVCIGSFVSHVYYVDCENGDDSTGGTSNFPLKTMQSAIDRIIALNDGKKFFIFYSETIRDESGETYTEEHHYAFVNIEPGDKQLTLEIIGLMGGDDEKQTIRGNGTGRVFYIGKNADVMLSNGVVVSGGTATTETCDRGGGIYIADGGKLTLSSNDYLTDNTASLTGSEDIYLESGASLWLQSAGNAGAVYLEAGADFATHDGLMNAYGSHEYVCGATITPALYGDDTVWVTYWETDAHTTQCTNAEDWAVLRAIEAVHVANHDGKTYALTASGTIAETGVETTTSDLATVLASYENLSETYTSENPLSLALTDASPDLSAVNTALRDSPVYVALDLHACTELTEIGASGASNSSTEAFQKCEKLVSLWLPDTVTAINNYAFYNCTSLTYMLIPDTLAKIEKGILYGSAFLYFRITNGLTEIPEYAFWKSNTSSLFVTKYITSIGKYAFAECNSLYSLSFDSESTVTTLPQNAFRSCTNLQELNLPASLTTIEDAALYECTGLTTVTIPESVSEIGIKAFAKCENLSSIVFECDENTVWEIYQYDSETNAASDTVTGEILTSSLMKDPSQLTSDSVACKLVKKES